LELIVTCARHFEEETKNEILGVLEELGDVQPAITITNFSGILIVKTSINHTHVLEQIRKKIEDEPWAIRYMLRVIPLFDVTKCDIDSITKSAVLQAQKIKSNETYRITIEKRETDIRSAEIITQIATRLENKVSLEDYDWIILIQTVGDLCGVSVLKDDEILSVERLKRGSLE
jgi:tRNA acetyltransferase TAN1